MNGGMGANVPVTELLTSTSNYLKLLRNNAKEILQRNLQLNPVRDAFGRWHSPQHFLHEMLLSLQRIEHDGLIGLRQRDVPILRQIFDDIEVNMAYDLEPHVNEVDDIAATFEEWIYQSLYPFLRGQSSIYSNLAQSTSNLRQNLTQTRDTLLASDRSAILGRRTRPSFPPNQLCPGAIKLINGHDYGRITLINTSRYYLARDSGAHLRANGGNYRWWNCPFCAFRCEFYVGSGSRSLSRCTRILTPKSHPDIRYRSILSAKYHLPTEDVKDVDRLETETLGCAVCVAEGRALRRGENIFKRRGHLLSHLRARHFDYLPTGLILDRLNINVGPYAPTGPAFDVHFMK